MMHPDHFDFFVKLITAAIAALAASVAVKVGMAFHYYIKYEAF